MIPFILNSSRSHRKQACGGPRVAGLGLAGNGAQGSFEGIGNVSQCGEGHMHAHLSKLKSYT